MAELRQQVDDLEKSLAFAKARLRDSETRATYLQGNLPAQQFTTVVQFLGEMLDFLSGIQMKRGRFILTDALRHAFTTIGSDRPAHKARNRMVTSRRMIDSIRSSNADTSELDTRIDHRGTESVTYRELSLLLHQKPFGQWFGGLTATIAGNSLLATPVVHAAMVAHMLTVRNDVHDVHFVKYVSSRALTCLSERREREVLTNVLIWLLLIKMHLLAIKHHYVSFSSTNT